MSKKKHIDFSDRFRVVALSFFNFFLFCLLIVQFYKLQIIEGEKWTKEGQIQHHHVVIEPFMRGRFFSNTSIKKGHLEIDQPLVMDVPKFHVYIDPDNIPKKDKDPIQKKIFSLVYLPKEKKEKVSNDFDRRCRSRKIISWLDKDLADELRAWWMNYAMENKIPKNAMFFIKDYKRSYPFKSLLGQVLHTVREEKESTEDQNYPTGGLELYFNELLKGKSGSKLMMHSPRHPLDAGKVLSYPENGADVYLTINHYLQAIAEEELEKGVKELKAKGAWAIMMDPYTGEILALAQYPFFDITNYSKYFNDLEKIEHTRVKAVMDAFEPASIFKPITLAICYKANEEREKTGLQPIFTRDEKVATDKGYFPGRPFPLKDGRKHNFLNMDLAIQKSSNIYVSKMVNRVINEFGVDWYKKQLHEVFGFGKKTNIELPSETLGSVPTPGKKHPNGKLEWSLATPYSLAIGHNILVNSMQMVRAFGIIANRGMEVNPTLIKKIVKRAYDGSDKIIYEKKNDNKKRMLSKKSCDELIHAMKFTTKLGGTARLGDIMGYTEAGKSGTSEKIIDGKYSRDHYLSSFVGFAPANNPRFVLMIVIDDPVKDYIPGYGKTYHGGVSAAPIFREIGRRSLQYLGVAPDDPFGYPYGDARRNPKKADWADEVQDIINLYKKWNQ